MRRSGPAPSLRGRVLGRSHVTCDAKMRNIPCRAPGATIPSLVLDPSAGRSGEFHSRPQHLSELVRLRPTNRGRCFLRNLMVCHRVLGWFCALKLCRPGTEPTIFNNRNGHESGRNISRVPTLTCLSTLTNLPIMLWSSASGMEVALAG